MGFRNRRRRGGGGGGGGGGGPAHGHAFFGGEANGMNPGDDVGNRKSFKPVIVPAEDLGNRKDPDEVEWIPEDTVGNRVDIAPTHEISGVLLDMDGKRRRRRPKGMSVPERVGRFLVGGVNPLISGGMPRAGLEAAHQAFEQMERDSAASEQDDDRPRRDSTERTHAREPSGREEGEQGARDQNGRDQNGRDHGGREPKSREHNGREQNGRELNGRRGGEIAERRSQRFFDFVEDDRFEYTLKTPAEDKRRQSEQMVHAMVREAGRDATVVARLLEDATRPKVLVTIDERGASDAVPPQRRSANSAEPLFLMGNAALMSLNYLVNKIVNRYPDDRIRLAVLPAKDERIYLDSLAEHQLTRAPAVARDAAVTPSRDAVPSAPAPARDDGVLEADLDAAATAAPVGDAATALPALNDGRIAKKAAAKKKVSPSQSADDVGADAPAKDAKKRAVKVVATAKAADADSAAPKGSALNTAADVDLARTAAKPARSKKTDDTLGEGPATFPKRAARAAKKAPVVEVVKKR